MDTLMMGDQENIKIRTCPFCRKPIINTNRYKDTVNRMFKKDINPIKLKVYGTNKQIQKKLEELEIKVREHSEKYRHHMEDFKEMKATFVRFLSLLSTQKKVSLLQVEMECVYLNVFEMIVECWQKYRTQKLQTTTLRDELQTHIKTLLVVLKIKPNSKIPIKISEQQQNDIGNEIKRLNVMVQFSTLLHLATSMKNEPQVVRQVEATKAVVFSLSVFNEERALESLKELQKVIKTSGVVSKYERQLIVKAIGLKAGHWFKCPNGHYYCIGECGGAMETSRCPDCGATIGGAHHTLTPGNQHAREMDGSSFAAWSEQNNLANFDLNNLNLD